MQLGVDAQAVCPLQMFPLYPKPLLGGPWGRSKYANNGDNWG